MPIYEYQCQQCQAVFEEWQSGFEDREMECPDCGEMSKRLISQSAFHLKGSGWYADGYSGRNAGNKPAQASGSGDGNGAKGDVGGSESAPAPKQESTDTSSAGSAS